MSRSKHSEAQIIAALKQVEAGRTAEDVVRECSVSKHRSMRGRRSSPAWKPAKCRRLKCQSYGKDAGYACLENASGVSHFATTSTAA